MKFKLFNKGYISTYFNECGDYSRRIGNCHTGVDWNIGYGKPVHTDNAGYVYKVYKPHDREDNWTAVYLLVPYEDKLMEVCIGHLSKVFVEEGQWIPENYVVGEEGNFGKVYSGGTEITPVMQDTGDKRGSHVHEQYRPVREVDTTDGNKHYLNGSDGRRYTRYGKFFEVINENELRGCVDPMQFAYMDTFSDKLKNIKENVRYLFNRFNYGKL